MRDTLLFSKKKTQVAPRSSCYRQSPTFVRTKSRRACAKAVLRAAATLYDRAKLRSSGRIVVSVLASQDRFEVLGVRGDINKSTTFGTEDKYNPFRSRNLSCATIPNPAERRGNRNRGGPGNRKCGQDGKGVVVVESEYATESAFKFEHAEASNSSGLCCRELCAPT